MGPRRMPQELEALPDVAMTRPPTAVSAEIAYHNLALYGPVGITEMPHQYGAWLDPPQELHSYFETNGR
jgi:hypothetical protein